MSAPQKPHLNLIIIGHVDHGKSTMVGQILFRLFDIIDERVMKEGEKEHIMAVANLAGRCLELNGKKPPTMKEVTMELEGIRKL